MATRKRIKSAIHNWAHSFMSIENYDEKGYFVKELYDFAKMQGVQQIEIDVLAEKIFPASLQTERLNSFIGTCKQGFNAQLASQNVEPERIRSAILNISYDFEKPVGDTAGFSFRDPWKAPVVAIYKTEIVAVDDLQKVHRKEILEWWR